MGTVLGAVLSLLAFLLGFTFNMAAGRFQDRREILIKDVNSIETAYRRYTTIPDSDRAAFKKLFLDYIDDRSPSVPSGVMFTRSQEIQSEIWSRVLILTANDRSPIASQFIESVTHMLDVHNERYTILSQHRIPDVIWFTLIGILLLCNVALGFQNSLTNKRRTAGASFLVLAFAVVIVVIADMDRPGEGVLQIDQQSIVHLRNTIANM